VKRNLLHNVYPQALSLVSKGANRKRFFMRKEAEEHAADLIALPGANRIVKTADWSAVYCVVAEPGWEEDPGLGAPDQSIPDVWRDEDEIRKAAHRFAESGGLINCMHKSLEQWGTMVESYICPADVTVEGETIRKGSWVIAINPNAAGREAIESGEFTGISIEGIGSRDLVEKAGNPGSTGAMVALYPTPELATELAIPKGESPGDLHLTLAFLGDAGDAAARDAALAAVRTWAAACPPLAGEVSGVGHFVSGPDPVTYLSVDLPDLPAQREALVAALETAGQPAAGDHGFTPHMTLAYSKRQPKFDAPVPVTFDRATLAWAGEQTSVPLGEKVAKSEPNWVAIDRLEKGTTGYLCSGCGHFMPTTEARDRAACPECKNRFRNAPVGYLAKAAGLPGAIAKDAILVPNKPGVTNWIERAGGLPKFMADVAGDLISEKGKTVGNAIQMAIGIIRNWARGQGGVSLKTKAKAIAALAEYEAKRAKAHIAKEHAHHEPKASSPEIDALTADEVLIAKADARAAASSAGSGSLGAMADRFHSFFRKLGANSGMSEEELAEFDELEKATPRTFGEVISAREFEDELPDAFNALRDAIYNAFYPMVGEDDPDPKALIAQSLDEFKAWCLELLDAAPSAVAKVAQQVADDVAIAAGAEDLAKANAAVSSRAATVKQAFAAAHKKYPDGVPASVTKAIFKDPAAWLKSNGGDTVKKAGPRVSEEAWDGDVQRFTDEQLDRSCLIEKRLPVLEPDGAISRVALGQAAAALTGDGDTLKDVEPAAIAKAKHQLASLYKAADEEVPDDLAKFAAVASSADSGNFGFEMLTPEELERIEKLETAVDELPAKIAKQLKDDAAEADGDGDGDGKGDEAPTVDSLAKAQEELDSKVDGIAADVKKLGAGGQTGIGAPGGNGSSAAAHEGIL
jgi:2'-5' RNA ligase